MYILQVMVGELPSDFLRINSTPQQQQSYADERVARILQAQQQAGFMPIPANVRGRLNVSIVQVDGLDFVSYMYPGSTITIDFNG